MQDDHSTTADGPEDQQPLRGVGWQIPVAHVHDQLKRQQKADETACAALAQVLDVEECRDVMCDIDLAPIKQGRFKGTLRISGAVTQVCVVTLDPLTSMIDETVDIEFWPEKQVATWENARGEEAEIDGTHPDIEPIEDDLLDVGRIVYENLTISIDPHPRAPNAVLDQNSTETDEERAAERPFAALEKLRRADND